LPGIDADPLSPTKPGILTTISVNEQNYKIVEKMQPFSFYKVNLSKTMLGERRDLFAGSHSEFVEVNRTDITKEQMMVWLNKNYPIQTLAALKNNLSKTIAAKQAGKQPRVDILDFRQIEVYITQAKNGITKDSKWYLYTVQDDSLSEDEKRETKIGDKTIYGGVTMSVPRHIYEQLNLDAGSIIRALVTVRKSAPAEDGIQKSKVGIQLDAIAVFALVPVEKKKPQIQGASQQLGKNVGVGAFDLTSQ
jgi:hypothetical protein